MDLILGCTTDVCHFLFSSVLYIENRLWGYRYVCALKWLLVLSSGTQWKPGVFPEKYLFRVFWYFDKFHSPTRDWKNSRNQWGKLYRIYHVFHTSVEEILFAHLLIPDDLRSQLCYQEHHQQQGDNNASSCCAFPIPRTPWLYSVDYMDW